MALKDRLRTGMESIGEPATSSSDCALMKSNQSAVSSRVRITFFFFFFVSRVRPEPVLTNGRVFMRTKDGKGVVSFVYILCVCH